MKNFCSAVEALSDMKNRGYEVDFATTSFCLYCGDLDIRLDPDDFHIDEVYRFEDTSGDDNSFVYAITSKTGVKGTLVDARGGRSVDANSAMACKLNSYYLNRDVPSAQ